MAVKLAAGLGADATVLSRSESKHARWHSGLAVHWSRVDDVLNQTGDLSGRVIVTCSLPMNDDNTELVVAHTSCRMMFGK
jgi:hypothetical protein